MAPEPVPFHIDVDRAAVADLGRRIRDTRWSSDFGNDDGRYGLTSTWLRSMAKHWSEEFDWKAQEATLNAWPQFRVSIDGVPIHFVHVESPDPNAIPIMLSHGWPWTFFDWMQVVDRLADPRRHGIAADVSFDIVVPSLPGFGFSSPLTTTGVDTRAIGRLLLRLMREVLGYDSFVVAGGDFGASLSADIAHRNPEAVKGLWLTLPRLPGVDLRTIGEGDFADHEQWMLDRAREARQVIQSHVATATHEPQTLAYALADSPMGLAAWIWARRKHWSDNGGDIHSAFSRDFLCTTASIYWFTETIGSSLRIYIEQLGNPRNNVLSDQRPLVKVPTAFAVFPKELLFLPRAVAGELTNLARWQVMPAGGHFAPAEQPDLVAADLVDFVAGL